MFPARVARFRLAFGAIPRKNPSPALVSVSPRSPRLNLWPAVPMTSLPPHFRFPFWLPRADRRRCCRGQICGQKNIPETDGSHADQTVVPPKRSLRERFCGGRAERHRRFPPSVQGKARIASGKMLSRSERWGLASPTRNWATGGVPPPRIDQPLKPRTAPNSAPIVTSTDDRRRWWKATYALGCPDPALGRWCTFIASCNLLS